MTKKAEPISKGINILIKDLSYPSLEYLLRITSEVLKELPEPSVYDMDKLFLHQRLTNEEWFMTKQLQDRKYITWKEDINSSTS